VTPQLSTGHFGRALGRPPQRDLRLRTGLLTYLNVTDRKSATRSVVFENAQA
jgi:hypothetical protein